MKRSLFILLCLCRDLLGLGRASESEITRHRLEVHHGFRGDPGNRKAVKP